jgi:amino acid permease
VLVAFEGATVAVRVSLPPSVRVMELLLRLTPVAATVVGVGGVGLSGSSGPQPAKNVAMATKAMAMRVLVIGVFMVLCIKVIVLNSLSPLFFENKYNK